MFDYRQRMREFQRIIKKTHDMQAKLEEQFNLEMLKLHNQAIKEISLNKEEEQSIKEKYYQEMKKTIIRFSCEFQKLTDELIRKLNDL